MSGLRIVFFFALSVLSVAAETPSFALGDNGFVLKAGVLGEFTIEAPVYVSQGVEEKPVFERKSADTGVAGYASGMKLEFEIHPQEVRLHFFNAPATEKSSFKFVMLVPLKFNQGGKYAFDAAEPKILPAELDGQFVQHGSAASFTLLDESGTGFTLVTPGGYQGLQDNRLFNWAVFAYMYQFDIYGKSEGWFSFGVKAAGVAPAEGKRFTVDRFGQSARVDFPGKVKSEDELKADGERQRAEMTAAKPDPALDSHGGLAGSGTEYKLEKTGFFHVGAANGRQVLVTPEGNVFFQLGMCGIASTDDFTTVKGREEIFEWLPSAKDETYRSAWREGHPDWGIFSFYAANWIRKFGKPFTLDEWTSQVVRRLRSWGFNSAGAFSSDTPSMKSLNFPYVTFLPLGGGDGVQVLPEKIGAADVMDPFAPGTEEALDKKFAKDVAPHAGDPRLIGYFLGNEQHFETLPKKIPGYKASQAAAKARLVEELKKKYKDIAQFNEAWNPATPATDFDALKEMPLFVRTDAAAADMRDFFRLYLETYYSMVERVFRRHDPNHLLIGSRWTPATANNRDVVEIGGKHLDVLSINYYTDAIETGFLKKVDEWSGGKPMIFSEWYYSTTLHGLGASRRLKDEKARGAAYRNYVEQSAALPFVVGSEWFIYTDQALTGRFFEGFHGEGNNTGFVDVTDRPYTDLVNAARLTHARIYDVMMGKTPPFAYDDPRFKAGGTGTKRAVQIPMALPGMKLDGTTTNWPGRPAEPIASSRAVEGLPNPAFSADFRLCWDKENLYIHVQVKDPTPLKTNKEGANLWSADGVELFLGARDLDQGGSMTYSDRQILIGASEKMKLYIVDHPEDAAKCQVVVRKDVAGDGYVLQAALPWKVLGVEPKAGMEMLFDLMIDNSDDGDARMQQLAWNGTKGNSGDRGAWGRAQLVEN